MAKPIAQRIWYLDEQDKRHEVVVRQGDSRFRLESGVIRGPDSERPGVTLSVPLHRVLMIEDHATQGDEYVDADDLRRRAEESIKS
jgi:hypothetical protein